MLSSVLGKTFVDGQVDTAVMAQGHRYTGNLMRSSP